MPPLPSRQQGYMARTWVTLGCKARTGLTRATNQLSPGTRAGSYRCPFLVSFQMSDLAYICSTTPPSSKFFGFSKERGGGFPFRPFPSLSYPSGQIDVRLFWIRPPEGAPSSDLDPFPTGRGGDSSMRYGTRTWRAWDDAY